MHPFIFILYIPCFEYYFHCLGEVISMYESEEIYYTGDYEDVGPAEHMDVDEQPIYYQDVSHPIDQPNMSMGEPGPSNYYQQQFDSRFVFFL